MKGIVIGAGYVGRACIAEWPDLKDTFIATTTRKEKVQELLDYTPHVEVVWGNDKEKLQKILARCDFAIICTAPKNRSKYIETYLETAQTITDVLSQRTTPFYLLYTSSTSVYGNHKGAKVNESSVCLADSNNGRTLIDTEQCYLQAANQVIEVCILRLGGICGPGREISSRAIQFSGQSLTGRDTPTNQSPLPTITKGITWCVKHRLTGIYNLVEDHHPTRSNLYEPFIEKLKQPNPRWKEPHLEGALVSNQKIVKTGFSI